jgi:hypothetical protein
VLEDKIIMLCFAMEVVYIDDAPGANPYRSPPRRIGDADVGDKLQIASNYRSPWGVFGTPFHQAVLELDRSGEGIV